MVLPHHSMFMSTLAPGLLVIETDEGKTSYYVRGGFADVNPDGVIVLAEIAVPEGELTGDVLRQEQEFAEAALNDNNADTDERLNAERARTVLAAY